MEKEVVFPVSKVSSPVRVRDVLYHLLLQVLCWNSGRKVQDNCCCSASVTAAAAVIGRSIAVPLFPAANRLNTECGRI
jgi:hypothetical protein